MTNVLKSLAIIAIMIAPGMAAAQPQVEQGGVTKKAPVVIVDRFGTTDPAITDKKIIDQKRPDIRKRPEIIAERQPGTISDKDPKKKGKGQGQGHGKKGGGAEPSLNTDVLRQPVEKK
jgi:hypothetical protein